MNNTYSRCKQTSSSIVSSFKLKFQVSYYSNTQKGDKVINKAYQQSTIHKAIISHWMLLLQMNTFIVLNSFLFDKINSCFFSYQGFTSNTKFILTTFECPIFLYNTRIKEDRIRQLIFINSLLQLITTVLTYIYMPFIFQD